MLYCSVPHHAMPFRGWNCLGIEESQDGNGILNTRAKLKSLRLVDLTAARAQIRKEMRADYRPGRLNLGLKGPRFRPEPGASLIRKFCFPLSYVFFLVCFFLCFFFLCFFLCFFCVFFSAFTGHSISFDTKITYIVKKLCKKLFSFSVWFFFLIKSNFHGNGSWGWAEIHVWSYAINSTKKKTRFSR